MCVCACARICVHDGFSGRRRSPWQFCVLKYGRVCLCVSVFVRLQTSVTDKR